LSSEYWDKKIKMPFKNIDEVLKIMNRIAIVNICLSLVLSAGIGYIIWKKDKVRWIAILSFVFLFVVFYFVLGAVMMFLFSPVW
jgi:membrane protein YdbS with pleckstrin-like domain